MAVMFQAIGSDTEISGVYVSADNVTGDTAIRIADRGYVHNCRLEWNPGATGEGVRFAGDVGRVSDVYVNTNGKGMVCLTGADRNIVADCYVSGNAGGVDFAGNYCRIVGSSIISSNRCIEYATGGYAILQDNDCLSFSSSVPAVDCDSDHSAINTNRIVGGSVGLDLGAALRTTVSDNLVKDPAGSGIVADGISYSTIADNVVEIDAATGWGIEINAAASLHISGNNVAGVGDGGISVSDSVAVEISSNVIEQDDAAIGISIDWTATPAGEPEAIVINDNIVRICEIPLEVVMTDGSDFYRGLVISGNYLEGVQSAGLGGECTVEDAPGCVIASNVFRTSGLGISDSKGASISNNEFTESAATLPTGWTGMLQVDACDGANIGGNTHSGSALASGDGFIQLTGSLSNAFVHGCSYSGAVPGGAATFLDYGLIIDSGCTAVQVGICDFRLAATLPVLDNGTASVIQTVP